VRRLIGFVLLVACASNRAPTAPTETKTAPAASHESVESHGCSSGMASLFLRDDTTHCVWRCDPEDDEPCPQDFACVGVGRTSGDTLARYCETLKGPGIADGISYPNEWRPKPRAK
jgi:hypothetical protein